MMPNYLAVIVTFAIAFLWLRLMDFIAHRGWISGKLSRKIIHTGTGPIFVLCWLLFKNTLDARWLAALVPFGISVQFLLIGLGVIKDQASVDAMSRSGDRREILRGPLIYGIVFVILTLVFWYDSPVGIVALMLLCGGDGFADIIGTRLGKVKIPWSPDKSWAGTFGMLLGGWIFAMIVIGIFVAVGALPGPFTHYITGICVITVVGTLVESLPINDFDNLTVPAVAVLLGILLF
jgi:phytol kinase